MTSDPDMATDGAWSPADAVVAVAGLGITGQAVSQVLLDRGARVFGVDGGADPQAPALGALRARGLEITTKNFDQTQGQEWLTDIGASLLIASPGWRPTEPLLAAARALNIAIWSEAELAWRLRSALSPSWLVVTGTNGKTTTVLMLEALLTSAGFATQAVGNIGRPLIHAALDDSLQILAVELSSFQLHHTYTMEPLASALLNIAPDHLDWHGSYEEYRAAKAKIYEHTTSVCLYNAADYTTEELLRAADVASGTRAIGITLGIPTLGTLGVVDGHLYDRGFTPERRTSAQEIGTLSDLVAADAPQTQLPAHLVVDALFAAGLALAAGVAPDQIPVGLRRYTQDPGGAQHRGEIVAIHNDVAYVNNSKATNPHAAQAAFSGLKAGTVVWIAGGVTKGASFEHLIQKVLPQLRFVVLIGAKRDELIALFARHAPGIPVIEIDERQNGSVCTTGGGGFAVMDRAVAAAQADALAGDTVLLAPACASQDQFASFAERGEAFRAAVQNLTSKEGGEH